MLLFFFFPFETLECPSIPLFLTQHVDANTCKILLLAEWGGGVLTSLLNAISLLGGEQSQVKTSNA